jgi:hypothetical protein
MFTAIVVETPFESWNGLIGMNRDVLMRLIKTVSKTKKAEEKIRNVLIHFLFLNFDILHFCHGCKVGWHWK